MTDHDPLCPMDHVYGSINCYCDLIARARADERAAIHKALDAEKPRWEAEIRADEREKGARRIEEFADDWTDWWEAIAETKRDMFAVQDLVREAVHDAAYIARGESDG